MDELEEIEKFTLHTQVQSLAFAIATVGELAGFLLDSLVDSDIRFRAEQLEKMIELRDIVRELNVQLEDMGNS